MCVTCWKLVLRFLKFYDHTVEQKSACPTTEVEESDVENELDEYAVADVEDHLDMPPLGPETDEDWIKFIRLN